MCAERRSPVLAARRVRRRAGCGRPKKQMNLTRWDEPAEIGAEAITTLDDGACTRW